MRAAPEGWIPLRELRPVERAVVRAVAYRGAVPPAPEYPDISGTPPCCWVLLELLDPGMIIPGRRKSGEAPREGPRLVSAPVFAGGDRGLSHPVGEVRDGGRAAVGEGREDPDVFRGSHRGGGSERPGEPSRSPNPSSPRRRRTALRTERTRRTARSGTSRCRRRRGRTDREPKPERTQPPPPRQPPHPRRRRRWASSRARTVRSTGSDA